MTKVLIFMVFSFAFTTNCNNSAAQVKEDEARTQVQGNVEEQDEVAPPLKPRPAAFETATYLPKIAGQRVALVVNQTSTLGDVHLVDTLLDRGVDVRKIFAPEHGFRGSADAGATIENGRDAATDLPIQSLYGKNKKPSAADLTDVDVIIFDIQDVGARFYTYISTLYYVLEAAAEQGKKVLVLDRPNPNGHYVDGPVRDADHESFVSIAPIPVVHGLTVGEFANMCIGEDWIGDSLHHSLEIITMPGYTHDFEYELPVPPSPNLPNQRSIYLYPSLCFFEGTAVSVGRGTNTQFQIYGHPRLGYGDHFFTPRSGPGSKYPKLQNQRCQGVSYTGTAAPLLRRTGQLDLQPLLSAHRAMTNAGEEFFTRPDFFDLLAGNSSFRESIVRGETEPEIRASWEPELRKFRAIRERYLLYP